MKTCVQCGKENESTAVFCARCGKQLQASGGGRIPLIDDLFDNFNVAPVMRKTIIAIVLNTILFWGLGYWYLGYKKIDKYDWYMLGVAYAVFGVVSTFVPFLGMMYLTVTAALAYDLYEKANGRKGFVPAY